MSNRRPGRRESAVRVCLAQIPTLSGVRVSIAVPGAGCSVVHGDKVEPDESQWKNTRWDEVLHTVAKVALVGWTGFLRRWELVLNRARIRQFGHDEPCFLWMR